MLIYSKLHSKSCDYLYKHENNRNRQCSVLRGSDSGYLETMINDKTYLSAFVVVSNSEGRIFSCEAIDCLRKLRNVILWRKVKDKMMF